MRNKIFKCSQCFCFCQKSQLDWQNKRILKLKGVYEYQILNSVKIIFHDNKILGTFYSNFILTHENLKTFLFNENILELFIVQFSSWSI